MALYLGNKKVKLNLNGELYQLIIPNNEGIKLLSSDGYVLKDKNELRLIPKESE